ncbi:MAG: hypothetical protein NXI01_06940 [Gammaproteobacteria bacterium]|nr:hypothetical protein [Gammaproteobacteria bacterium]
MKKLIFVSLLNISSMAFATLSNQHLQITIKNNTPSNCYLTKINNKHGRLLPGIAMDIDGPLLKTMPLKILPGETSSPLTVVEEFSYGPQLHLTYECGEGRAITIESKQDLFRVKYGVYGKIIAATDMDATFDISLASFWPKTSGKINWILS